MAPLEQAIRSDDPIAGAGATSPLSRTLSWLAVIAFVYFAGSLLGIFFGVASYRIESASPPSEYRLTTIRMAQASIIRWISLAVVLFLLGRALLRYGRTQRRRERNDVPVEPAQLLGEQSACWRWLIWAALLHAGWGMVIAVIATRWGR